MFFCSEIMRSDECNAHDSRAKVSGALVTQEQRQSGGPRDWAAKTRSQMKGEHLTGVSAAQADR